MNEGFNVLLEDVESLLKRVKSDDLFSFRLKGLYPVRKEVTFSDWLDNFGDLVSKPPASPVMLEVLKVLEFVSKDYIKDLKGLSVEAIRKSVEMCRALLVNNNKLSGEIKVLKDKNLVLVKERDMWRDRCFRIVEEASRVGVRLSVPGEKESEESEEKEIVKEEVKKDTKKEVDSDKNIIPTEV